MSHKHSPSIAVIGAGLAGLSCATALAARGFNTQVFDKSRGPGGRMSTRRGEGWQCDHGAQYFTARDPAFREEVARWEAAGAAALWQPRVGAWDGSAWAQSDKAQVDRFVGTPGMTAPARLLAHTLPLRLECTVRELRFEADQWQLASAEHGLLEVRFDAVVLALPAPQVIPLLQPVAPEMSALATQARMRGAWALMLRFDAPLDLPLDAGFVNHGPLRWIARNSTKPGRNGTETWLLHATPEWSETHLEAAAEWVADELIAAFVGLGGAKPPAWSAHRWRYADTEPALDLGCAWDDAANIGLCGDWLCGGKVEGAWQSGRALADRVAAAFDTHPPNRG